MARIKKATNLGLVTLLLSFEHMRASETDSLHLPSCPFLAVLLTPLLLSRESFSALNLPGLGQASPLPYFFW